MDIVRTRAKLEALGLWEDCISLLEQPPENVDDPACVVHINHNQAVELGLLTDSLMVKSLHEPGCDYYCRSCESGRSVRLNEAADAHIKAWCEGKIRNDSGIELVVKVVADGFRHDLGTYSAATGAYTPGAYHQEWQLTK